MPAGNKQNFSSGASSPFRILIVDDDEVILGYCREILKRAGFTNVVLCADSRRATEHLAKEDIALIFLDLTMPHLSGLELMDIIMAEYPHIPITIITTANEAATAVECMRKGASDYLVKPIDPNRIVSNVEKAMEERQIQEECAALKKSLFSDSIQNPDGIFYLCNFFFRFITPDIYNCFN